MTTEISIWFFGNGQNQHNDPALYPMVSIYEDDDIRYFYHVSQASLQRLVRIVPYAAYKIISFNGWSASWEANK